MPNLDIKCIIPGQDTNGQVAVFEEVVDPGIGPPRHTHRNQFEIFHIIEGMIRFEIDGVVSEHGAGAAAVVPAGAVHAFRNIGTEAATIHFEMIPAGKSEEAFERIAAEGDSIEDVAAFFDQYDMDLCGPPLDGD
ncbi:MAG: quercetin dioxygenase-like cupin family protein [Verrucomicrobiales bacterium]|jgi:quercetin dioxygenase-like cupin family protein